MQPSVISATHWLSVSHSHASRLPHLYKPPEDPRSKMSDSIWDDPNVTSYILGELPQDEAEVFEKRMQEDPELAEVVAEARSVTEQLQVMYSNEENPTLETARRENITRNNPITSVTLERKTTWRVPLVLLATAAAFLLLVGGPLMMQREEGRIATDSIVPRQSARAPMQESVDAPQPPMAASTSSGITPDSPYSVQGFPNRSAADARFIEESEKSPGTLNESDMDFDMAESAGDSSDIYKGLAMGSGNPADKKIANELQRKSALQKVPLESAKTAGSQQAEITFDKATTDVPAPSSSRSRAEMPVQEENSLVPTPPETKDGSADRDRFNNITENQYKRVTESPLSTFSIDVDTASYSKVREYLLRQRRLPPVDAVRIEELVNYFDYEYLPPQDDAEIPFAATAEIISCPWNNRHRLARIALKGKEMQTQERPLSNLVFLLDSSGSMNARNKLPLVKQGMNMLLSQLGENDRVAVVVYAGSAGLVLDSTPATNTREIENALTNLAAGGSTNGGQGIKLAYQIARDNFIVGGVNRVILCTDGDFNVGTTGTGSLVRMVEKEAAGNIFLSVLGFGMGNHNDNMLEQISGRGNGNYAFIDTEKEAQKVLVNQVNGTLVTIAKDVKLQIEFNPRMVDSYRLIGYENRVLAKEDFNDDKKDAGEIGAGHAVTALYELIPAGIKNGIVPPRVNKLKYQSPNELTDAANRDESFTLKLRYKEPEGNTSKLHEFPVVDNETKFQDADHDARFAAAVANFGMLLRGSAYSGDWNFQDVIDVAKDAKGEDMSGLRAEFVEMVEAASKMQ